MITKKTDPKAVPAELVSLKKRKRRDKSDMGADFVAPDGGWGWVVCFAAGFSNFAMFPPIQQYGLIYRERMVDLGFDAKQTTTIVNIVMALSSLVGIVNGAMFRRFTFRQVSLFGACLVFIGILSSAFSSTFWHYIMSFSCIYGIGLGLCLAATSLAVNTYFKDYRRRATGFSWTITGLGPIIFPHVTTALLIYYGTQGTILIYAGFTLNGILCALTLQPVLWHVRKVSKSNDNGLLSQDVEEQQSKGSTEPKDNGQCKCKRRIRHQLFSSQYLFNEDDEEMPGYEIIEPGTPMLARANDGWFGSKISLNSEMSYRLRKNSFRRLSQRSIHRDIETDGHSNLFKPNNFNRELDEAPEYAADKENKGYSTYCVCENCPSQRHSAVESQLNTMQLKEKEQELDAISKREMTLKQKIVKFFDLDLLRDFTFVNLALGMTIMMFGEMNFSVLTPFILSSYGYSNEQISLAMSLLGAMDICVRFLAPFFLEKVKLSNQTLFSFGILTISLGRLLVTFSNSLNMILVTFIIIGFGKGFRTIFSPLIIPSYVPLNRLPAASGLQLVFNSVFSCIFGPILGILTDATSYTWTIHFINVCTCFALIMWICERIYRRSHK